MDVLLGDELIHHVELHANDVENSSSPLAGLYAAQLKLNVSLPVIEGELSVRISDTKQPVLKLDTGFAGC